MMEKTQKLSNLEKNSSHLCNHVTICCSSTDDEPDSLSLHVFSPDEEQGLWNKLGTVPLNRPISSFTVLSLLKYTRIHVNTAHNSVLILTRPFTINGYKVSSVIGNKCAYSKSLVTDRPTKRTDSCLGLFVVSSSKMSVNVYCLIMAL
jgi:hypothetical protein